MWWFCWNHVVLRIPQAHCVHRPLAPLLVGILFRELPPCRCRSPEHFLLFKALLQDMSFFVCLISQWPLL